MGPECLLQFRTGGRRRFQRDEGYQGLPLDVVGFADHGRLGHVLVADQGAFHFGRADPMPGDVQDIVDAADDPIVPRAVPATSVAGEVTPRDFVPVSFPESLRIAPNTAQHAGPGIADNQFPARVFGHRLALIVDDLGLHSEKGQGSRAWFGRSSPGQRGDHDTAGFGLPPGVHDGATAFADDLVIPHPGFGIDGFSHCSQ